MNRILISVLFVLVFSGPALANERLTLVCDWETSVDVKTGITSEVSGKSTFVFEENDKGLDLINWSGIPCSEIIKYQDTEFNILFECESRFGGIRTLNSFTINRVSGEISGIFQTSKDKLEISSLLIKTGICKKKSKLF